MSTEPREKTVRVYCAGKISKNDWRHDLFRGLRGRRLERVHDGPLIVDGPKPATRDGFEYSGPYFVQCDHGCYHGPNKHGVGATGRDCLSGPTIHRTAVPGICRNWIANSEAMFVWLDDATAYGTFAEIGIAVGLGVPVFLAIPEGQFAGADETWFPILLADERGEFSDPVSAFSAFGVWYRQISLRAYALDARREIASWTRRNLGVRSRKQGFIYLLRAEGEGVCKIGKTQSLGQRLRALAIQLPYEMRLEHSVRTDDVDAAERFFHTVFRHRRMNGEWFRLDAADVAFFKEYEEWQITV